jgi:hypothetical protein
MKKTFRVSLYILTILILLSLIAIPVYISYWRNSSTVETFKEFSEPKEVSFSKIKWQNDSLGNEIIEKVALFVPVKIDGINGNLFMQFDSGTQTTILYGKTLDELIRESNSVKTFYNQDSLRFLEKPTITIANTKFKAEKIRIASTLGSKDIDTSFINIGTIGFDAFVNRTLILDFKNNKLAITEKEAENLNYSLNYIKDASVDKFPLLIPSKINGNNVRLFYDTGSSMFSLLTSNNKLDNINSNRIDTLCCINNWGRKIPIHRKEMNVSVEIGEYSFDNKYVYGCEVLDMVDYLPNWFLFGITGNKMFDNKIVVIDTRNNKLGIKK